MDLTGIDEVRAHWPTLVLGVLAPSLAALIGASLGTRLSEKARRSVIKADLKAIIDEEFRKSHAQEQGKRLATAEDIGSVLEQLRRTELTKAEVEREARNWVVKRDMYLRLLEALGQTYSRVHDVAGVKRDGVLYGADQPPIQARAVAANTALQEAKMNLARTLSSASLVVTEDALEAVRACTRDAKLNHSEADWVELGKRFEIAIFVVTQSGRRDLKLET